LRKAASFAPLSVAIILRCSLTNGLVRVGARAVTTPFLTLQERDIETGLDFFESRYYSSTQGRFTSADEPFAGQDEEDPQTWNLYSYTSGNPLNRIDPDGRRWFYKCQGRNGCDIQWKELFGLCRATHLGQLS
jgi:RHS repeat-associated protein